MPARNEFHCCCAECVSLYGFDSNGQPIGKVFPASERIAHTHRVQAEAAAKLAEEREATTHTAAATVFAHTLADNGPNINAQPSRLWVSRSEYQGSAAFQTNSNEIPISAIIDGVRTLQALSPSTNVSGLLNRFQELAISPDRVQGDHRSPIPTHSSKSAQKKERNRATKKAHDILEGLEKRCQQYIDRVEQAGMNITRDDIGYIEAQVTSLYKGLENVKRNTESVMLRKNAVEKSLSGLHALIDRLRLQHPPMNNDPILYDTSKPL